MNNVTTKTNFQIFLRNPLGSHTRSINFIFISHKICTAVLDFYKFPDFSLSSEFLFFKVMADQISLACTSTVFYTLYHLIIDTLGQSCDVTHITRHEMKMQEKKLQNHSHIEDDDDGQVQVPLYDKMASVAMPLPLHHYLFTITMTISFMMNMTTKEEEELQVDILLLLVLIT